MQDTEKEYPQVSNEDLKNIKGMLEENESDFVDIYNRYEHRIRAYIRSLYFPDDILCSVETVHIDTFMKFRKTIAAYKGKENVNNRLRRIAYGLYADCMRKAGNIDLSDDTNIVEEDGSQNSNIIDRILCMQNCLDQSLKPSNNKNKCIKGLILFALGWSTQDITEKLVIATANAARQFLLSCRRKLKNMTELEECLEDCRDKVTNLEKL